MKDLSYLNAFNLKIIRGARRIINHGVTVEEIDEYLANPLEARVQEKVEGVDFTKMPVSKKYEIFQERDPDSKMTIEEFIEELRAGKVPCKNCPDKKQEE